MEENRRRTHANSIKRIKLFTTEENFENASSVELNERMEILKEAYANFVKEHQFFVANLHQTQFAAQDKYFGQMTELYQNTMVDFRKKILEVDTQDVIKGQQRQSNKKGVENRENGQQQENGQHRGNVRMNVNKEQLSNNNVRKERSPEMNVNKERLPKNNVRSFAIKSARYNFKLPNNDLRYRLTENVNVNKWSCNFCKGNHKIFDCTKFRNLTLFERRKSVRMANLCQNCFMPLGHYGHRCKSSYCRKCGPREFHNSLLCSQMYRRGF